MPIYADRDIFNRIRRGIDPDILAQLNSCSVDDIWRAYKRYEAVFNKQEKDYKKNVALQRKREQDKAERSRQQHETTAPNSGYKAPRTAVRYTYSREQERLIREGLAENKSIREIYDRVFRGIYNVRPSLKAFYSKCNRVKNSYSK